MNQLFIPTNKFEHTIYSTTKFGKHEISKCEAGLIAYIEKMYCKN